MFAKYYNRLDLGTSEEKVRVLLERDGIDPSVGESRESDGKEEEKIYRLFSELSATRSCSGCHATCVIDLPNSGLSTFTSMLRLVRPCSCN